MAKTKKSQPKVEEEKVTEPKVVEQTKEPKKTKDKNLISMKEYGEEIRAKRKAQKKVEVKEERKAKKPKWDQDRCFMCGKRAPDGTQVDCDCEIQNIMSETAIDKGDVGCSKHENVVKVVYGNRLLLFETATIAREFRNRTFNIGWSKLETIDDVLEDFDGRGIKYDIWAI